MTCSDAEFIINQGPSKLGLMLSLFNTDRGKRTVRFRIGAVPEEYEKDAWYEVQIISVRSQHPGATIWEMEGLIETSGWEQRVSIYYASDTREGRIRFEEKLLRTHGIMETPEDSKSRDSLTSAIGNIYS